MSTVTSTETIDALSIALHECRAERDALALELTNSPLIGRLRELQAENNCLAERLRGSPEMRDIVRELRRIQDNIALGHPLHAQALTEQLLRRLDVENL